MEYFRDISETVWLWLDLGVLNNEKDMLSILCRASSFLHQEPETSQPGNRESHCSMPMPSLCGGLEISHLPAPVLASLQTPKIVGG